MVECTDEHCGSGFFPVCEYCWEHESQVNIDKAIIELHEIWTRDCRRHNTEVPYKLEDMLEAAHKQRISLSNN